jgi:hypothetical protein
MPVNNRHCKWLPRIRKFSDNGCAVIWSAEARRDRRRVYRAFDRTSGACVRNRLNETTESFQWEPDLIASGEREVTVVWSSWGQLGKDYEIVGRRLALIRPQGYLDPATYEHSTGRTTTKLLVHVVDSTAVTGSTYEALLDTAANNTKAYLSVRNTMTGDSLVRRFPIDRGEGVFYLTPAFDGVALQVIPEFDLEIDFAGSYFINHSGTNLTFVPGYPSSGQRPLH